MVDNSWDGLKGPLVWTGHRGPGSNLSYSWHPECFHAQTHRREHTCVCRGHFPSALRPRPIWESSTSAALTFHCEVKGGGGVCERGTGGRERRTKRRVALFSPDCSPKKKRGCSLQAYYVQDCMEIEPKRWFTCTQLAPHLWISWSSIWRMTACLSGIVTCVRGSSGASTCRGDGSV